MELVEFSVSAPPLTIVSVVPKRSNVLSGQHSCSAYLHYLIARHGAGWRLTQHKDIDNNVQKSSLDTLFKAFFKMT